MISDTKAALTGKVFGDEQSARHPVHEIDLMRMKATLLLEPYKGWAQYERLREKNIEAAYNNLLEFE